MDDSNSPFARYLSAEIPLLAEHTRILQVLSSHVLAANTDFVGQWSRYLKQDPVLAHSAPTGELLAAALRALVDNLSVMNDWGHYLQGVAAWGVFMREQGKDYVDTTRWFVAFRRALLPIISSNFQAGAEMELLFRALDAHERAVLGTLAVPQISTKS